MRGSALQDAVSCSRAVPEVSGVGAGPDLPLARHYLHLGCWVEGMGCHSELVAARAGVEPAENSEGPTLSRGHHLYSRVRREFFDVRFDVLTGGL